MATNTAHINLIKPAYTDAADIADINSNMNTIDAEIYALKQKFPSSPLGIAKGGTNATTAEAARTQLGAAAVMIRASFGTVSSLPVTKAFTGVTADMAPCGFAFGNPSAFASNLTVTPANGSVTIAGTMRSGQSSTVTIVFTNSKNVTGT